MIPAHIAHVFKALDSSASSKARSNPGTVSASLQQKGSPCADTGTAGVGVLYPVTCRARYYEAASRILEEEGRLFTHANANALGREIQQWIESKRNNREPR